MIVLAGLNAGSLEIARCKSKCNIVELLCIHGRAEL
jgi:hypothetical protein